MMLTKTGRFTVYLLILLMPVLLYSLELESGRVRLEIDEKSGSFTLVSISEGQQNPLPLLYSDDPRTTGFSLAINNRIYNLQSSSDFIRETIREPGRIGSIWTSRQLEIRQEFRIIRSASSDVNNGIVIQFGLRNISSQNLTVGLRYLLDTYLGENNGNAHFVTSDNRSIVNETGLSPPFPSYILSSRGQSVSRGLMIMLRGPGLTPPDSVIFANWKRLNESGWSYTVSTSRSFTSPPYSINDSAVALFYNPAPLQAGEERTIILAMGAYAEGGYRPDSQNISDRIADMLAEETETGDPAQEVALLRELIAEIDQLMESEQGVPEEKIVLLRQLLAALKERRVEFKD
ncbi:hypothetical protein [Marispirochaeta sp.]|jgi:hypothetical protein|uniref:hypothetical protein n=1 Tax=Marispirochaeta sp. TaxID=2038653 RepID=UPI0029C91D7B|nr:hypothetical protein [Marispirochaeta sp.]